MDEKLIKVHFYYNIFINLHTLTLCMLHKNFRRYTEKVFLILCQKIGFDITNLHEMLKPIFWENKKNINLSSADFTLPQFG